jgi:nicotinamidase-related amidase
MSQGRGSRWAVSDCLLVIDLFTDFQHEDGTELLESVRRRHNGFLAGLLGARDQSKSVVFANDTRGIWDGDMRSLLRRAFEGPGGAVLSKLAPIEGEAFIVKPRYSAFDLTPLTLILEQLESDRLLLMGMATEMCVAQTAIDARERGYEVSVLVDACATLSERDERTALDYLENVIGVELRTTAESYAQRT